MDRPRRAREPAGAAFRGSLALALLTVLAVSGARATEEAGDGGPYTLAFESLGEGIELAYRPGVSRFPVVGNAVLVGDDEGSLLVDGGGGAPVAEQILARLAARGWEPLRYLVVTHWHADHTAGLGRYLTAFPSLQIISHPWTGEPLTAAARAAHEQLLADLPVLEREYARAGSAVPRLTTKGGLSVPGIAGGVELLHLGRGHTPGDLVVHLPSRGVVIAGDLVTYPLPFGFPSYPSEVAETIAALLGLEFDLLVPGHGPPLSDRSYVERVLALQRHAVAAIRELAAAGFDAEAIAARLDLGPHDEAIVGGDPRLAFDFERWYRRPLIGRVLAEAAAEAEE